MRLWHKDLVSVLPQKQFSGLWSEYCLIIKRLSNGEKENHMLINKTYRYDLSHVKTYGLLLLQERKRRNYKTSEVYSKMVMSLSDNTVSMEELFKEWHNFKYKRQCYYNLEEKYDCDGVSEEEWQVFIKNCKEFE